ncbi:MAG: 50S ribosomal protein L3 [Ignavibacteria bacterium GWA2_55_11]|nr:MAG: 50S ribosomal protein L3 [Ignavibacteria bacterium GWA2_55_11]OGU43464.1 MAG: 50S ribosomal protein L3 [Ignavibacteria bacterium GWC2_56_12]OGU64995.1 MAG: 50S ribosomal protein L3 [Ignavibacteria bacterium RIFCSPHIGHO2_02_FULL_56_12]OGU71878.1 MAG: 50S ribosomal protein L3 [Ignavibacteria bacterium RIFCSPLOWO2_12_FULL_56_21]OGU74645.1 MAG: 50S ribosomal protein L3 [Ignavibacteria bacterium RIFCSPLOWO2_02_FULL_55_14]HAV24130.1 50S ribosomal protein L3 [Bacteroidota bacterium]
MSGILGKKLGMTSIFNESGEAIPCTIIEAGPCYVLQVRTKERDGYDAVQLGFDEKPERLVSKPMKGQFGHAKTKALRLVREFRPANGLPSELGAEVRVDIFSQGDVVDVRGRSKGRGFQGVVKRHHFGGVGMTTHGQSDRVRAPGSIGSSSFPSRVFKGMRMAGRMGFDNVTVKNLQVLKVIPESNILIIKGSIPGAINGYVEIVKAN